VGTIHAHTTAFDFTVDTRPGETILEALRRNQLPAPGFLLYDDEQRFVSLTSVLTEGQAIDAHSLRNPDFAILDPSVKLSPAERPVAEIFAASGDQTPTLLQFDRQHGIDYVYAAVAKVLDDYRADRPADEEIQVALSGGGDGRIVGECLGRYRNDHPQTRFHAVITANGFEDEQAHLEAAAGIADAYEIAYSLYDEAASAKLLGFTSGFGTALERYRNEFPHDEAEILATYWVQELNFAVARDAHRHGIVFGFNQEDVIAERLYQALTGTLLPAYPVRGSGPFDLIAPLYQIPKRLIDALDRDNSLRNYQRRQPSVSYLRSSLYFLAYTVVERFPALAAAFADPSVVARASEEVPSWLINPSN
jgi:hypothetical protein